MKLEKHQRSYLISSFLTKWKVSHFFSLCFFCLFEKQPSYYDQFQGGEKNLNCPLYIFFHYTPRPRLQFSIYFCQRLHSTEFNITSEQRYVGLHYKYLTACAAQPKIYVKLTNQQLLLPSKKRLFDSHFPQIDGIMGTFIFIIVFDVLRNGLLLN